MNRIRRAKFREACVARMRQFTFYGGDMRRLAGVCLTFLSLCGSATAQTPTAPAGNANQTTRVATPDYLDHFRRATVSVGQVVNDGGHERFMTVGSAVIVAADSEHGVLITAKHVVFDPKSGYVPSQMYIRIPHGDSAGASDFGARVPLVSNGRNLWQSLPDGSDIALVPLPDLSQYQPVHAVLLSDFATQDDLYQGGNVIVLGYPAIAGEEYLTTPLARAGIVSWTDPIDPLGKRFLIDANVYNGNSGGPVFHLAQGFNRQGGLVVSSGASLLGIVVQDSGERAKIRAQDHDITVTDPKTGEVSPVYAEVLNIGSIGVVEPAGKIKKLVEQYFSQQ
ncbi:serine protease [Paraburkholderia sp. CNPSo 3281]|uniref:trypsin-like serine peptidase n=1 Tax=Paraburkholderia sp. CNPSo 3281 TaxID=2940933 RepID=UPI0020B6CE48|nr:serine protease [Paraburkholderia sp. CNPSo 3281]MCP3714880.1 serine protease [Paraburkholderia sp. CNPSo 3281]